MGWGKRKEEGKRESSTDLSVVAGNGQEGKITSRMKLDR
jgi:hypothetical protein